MKFSDKFEQEIQIAFCFAVAFFIASWGGVFGPLPIFNNGTTADVASMAIALPNYRMPVVPLEQNTLAAPIRNQNQAITVLTPRNGATWKVGSSYPILWKKFTANSDTFIYLAPEKGDPVPIGTATGKISFVYKVQAKDFANGRGVWQVMVCNGKYQGGAGNCGLSGKIKVTGLPVAPVSTIKVTAPTSGDTAVVGEPLIISWHESREKGGTSHYMLALEGNKDKGVIGEVDGPDYCDAGDCDFGWEAVDANNSDSAVVIVCDTVNDPNRLACGRSASFRLLQTEPVEGQ